MLQSKKSMQLKTSEAREVEKSKVTDPDLLVVNGKMVRKDATATFRLEAGDYYITKLGEDGGRVVICCPFCEMTIITDYEHRVIQKSPLTVENVIACPYSVHLEEKEVPADPPKKAALRLVWKVFGKKTKTIQVETYHAFSIKEGKIMTA